jgi:hypothetical protein
VNSVNEVGVVLGFGTVRFCWSMPMFLEKHAVSIFRAERREVEGFYRV